MRSISDILLLSFIFNLFIQTKRTHFDFTSKCAQTVGKYRVLCFTVVIHNYPSVAKNRIIDTYKYYHKILYAVKYHFPQLAFAFIF